MNLNRLVVGHYYKTTVGIGVCKKKRVKERGKTPYAVFDLLAPRVYEERRIIASSIQYETEKPVILVQVDIALRTTITPDLGASPSAHQVCIRDSQRACSDYAISREYTWKNDDTFPYGGYFVNANGDCLMPT